MISEEFQIVSENGVSLSGRNWLPQTSPKAIVCLIHGLGEHLGRYAHFAEPFTESNVGIFAVDLRGHGRSEGKRGAGRISSMVVDVQELVIAARREYNDLPIFLLGHSLGGLLVMQFLTKMVSREIKGAILSSPWIKRVMPGPSPGHYIGSVIRYIYPSLTVSNRISSRELANDPEVGKEYDKDPLVHGRIGIGLFFEIEKAAKHVLEKAHLVNMPTLVCHGRDDAIISPAGSQKIVQEVPSAQLKIWENARHEPHNDFDREKVVKFYLEWIKDRF